MKIRLLVAEDSITVRDLLIAVLGADPQIEIVGTAKDGLEAVEMTRRLRPDAITMDVHMPNMNGFEATRRIMAEVPTPIIIVSGNVDDRDVEFSLNALRAGAVALVPRPSAPASSAFEASSAELLRIVKAMSQVKVVRHWTRRPAPRSGAIPIEKPARIVAIAASTGGPAALERLFASLPGDFPAPILVVQHIAHGFVHGLCGWLDASSKLRVRVPRDREMVEAGTIYIAPEDRHLTVMRAGRILLSDDPPVGGFRPSGTRLFQSVAEHYGSSALAVVLTGMGNDGAAGLDPIRSSGGTIIAQDEATSVVFGMPAAAIATGSANYVLPLPEIADRLIQICHPKELDRVPNSGS